MRMPKLAGAFTIAMLTAAALHLSVKPAAADTRADFCTHLNVVEMSILSSDAPDFAKEIAIAAIYGTKKAAGCDRLSETAQ